MMANLKLPISNKLIIAVITKQGRAIAQAVSRQLSTATARVRARVRSCGICGGQSGTGAGFLRVLRFPLPIRIPAIAPQSSPPIIWGWYNRPNSGRSIQVDSVSPQEKNKKKIKNNKISILLDNIHSR
jgi:hypothetical protein